MGTILSILCGALFAVVIILVTPKIIDYFMK